MTNTSTVNALNVTVSEPNDTAHPFTGTGTPPVPGNEVAGAGNTAASTDAAVNASWDVLAPSETVTFTASYRLTQADIDAGMVDNSALAGAIDPFGNDLADTSDDATPGTGAGNDDPTSTPLGVAPELTVAKTAAAPGPLNADGTFTQGFSIVLTNSGNATITNPTLTDDVEALFADAYDPSDAGTLGSGAVSYTHLTLPTTPYV